MVVEEGILAGAPFAVNAKEAVFLAEPREHGRRRAPRPLDQRIVLQQPSRGGECADGQAIPAGQNLVVGGGRDPARAGFEQAPTSLAQHASDLLLAPTEAPRKLRNAGGDREHGRPPLEISAGEDTETR